MNIDSILSKIKLFEELVINSGFKRDVMDFASSIQQNPTIASMTEVSKKIQNWFEYFEDNSLDSELTILIKKDRPFTSLGIVNNLQNLDSNKTMDAISYLHSLMEILSPLINCIHNNEAEIKEIKEVFARYTADKIDTEVEKGEALVSLVFKDIRTIAEFSGTLKNWNLALRMLHQLVKSESPEAVSIVQIQNGSVDVILNIDINVAIDLYKLVEVGTLAYGGYILFKLNWAEFVETFSGKKLIEMKEEIEREMLENIQSSVEDRAMEIHEERLQNDSEINTESVKGKITFISTIIINHIVNGNEVKLLTAPQHRTKQSDEKNLSEEARKKIVAVRKHQKSLSQEDKRLLLERYTVKEEDKPNGEDG